MLWGASFRPAWRGTELRVTLSLQYGSRALLAPSPRTRTAWAASALHPQAGGDAAHQLQQLGPWPETAQYRAESTALTTAAEPRSRIWVLQPLE